MRDLPPLTHSEGGSAPLPMPPPEIAPAKPALEQGVPNV